MKKILLSGVITALIGTGVIAGSVGSTITLLPQPIAMLILGTALVALAGMVRRKNRKTAQ